MWWTGKIDSSKATTNRIVKSIILKAVGERFVVRMNFADGTFFDVDMARLPRFDLGEIVTISLVEDIIVPTKDAAPSST